KAIWTVSKEAIKPQKVQRASPAAPNAPLRRRALGRRGGVSDVCSECAQQAVHIGILSEVHIAGRRYPATSVSPGANHDALLFLAELDQLRVRLQLLARPGVVPSCDIERGDT